MDVLPIILLALLVIILITGLLVLRARSASKGRRDVRRRVEARARMSEAGDRAQVAEREQAAAAAERDRAERERRQAEAHMRKAEAAEQAAEERARVAAEEREAAERNRERALSLDESLADAPRGGPDEGSHAATDPAGPDRRPG
jgi:biopolymer transport protein ExbB/TolQ